MTDTDQAGDIMARIVSAYAARPDVGPDDIVALVARLKHELTPAGGVSSTAGISALPVNEVGRAEPALPIENAVTEDKVFCLCCGKGFKMLKRHLGAEHGLTEAEYRLRFGLSDDMPLVAPSYSVRKANYAKQSGLGRYSRDPAEAAHHRDPAAKESIS